MTSPESTLPARLLGDVGGTNARFALQSRPGAPLSHVRTLPCADHPSIEAAIRAYAQAVQQPLPAAVAFGIANPVVGDRIAMTNHHWSFSISELRHNLGAERLVVVNDFTALALSLPDIPASDLRQVGGGAPAPHAAIGLIGPGTGLGVSGLLALTQPGRYAPIAGEGGHSTLAPETALEFAVVSHLRERFGHVSAERVISGPGLLDLCLALAAVQGLRVSATTPAGVMQQAQAEPDGPARAALQMFCGFLGSVAGNLALTLGARGGVYIGGGVVPRMGALFDASPFRERFEAKGRFRSYLADIPVWVIDAPTSPALLGAARALDLG